MHRGPNSLRKAIGAFPPQANKAFEGIDGAAADHLGDDLGGPADQRALVPLKAGPMDIVAVPDEKLKQEEKGDEQHGLEADFARARRYKQIARMLSNPKVGGFGCVVCSGRRLSLLSLLGHLVRPFDTPSLLPQMREAVDRLKRDSKVIAAMCTLVYLSSIITIRIMVITYNQVRTRYFAFAS